MIETRIHTAMLFVYLALATVASLYAYGTWQGVAIAASFVVGWCIVAKTPKKLIPLISTCVVTIAAIATLVIVLGTSQPWLPVILVICYINGVADALMLTNYKRDQLNQKTVDQ